MQRSIFHLFGLLATATSVVEANSSACKLPAIRDVTLSSGFITKENYDCAPSTGTLRGLLLFVDFSDEPATETAKELHDTFFPGTNQWYHTSSYGKLALNITTNPDKFYRMPKTAARYNFGRGLSYEDHLEYILDAFKAWQETSDVQVSSSSDPLFDVLYIVATANARSISTSATLTSPVHTLDNKLIASRAVTLGPEDDPGYWEKVFQHETGHALCLPDMYPLTDADPAKWTGNWDIMATIQDHSQDFFAWNKWRLGWLDDNQIDCISESGSTTHQLTALETVGGVKAVVIKQSETEALVAEVRSNNGVDKDVCSPGVLLYTVSTNVATGEGPFRVIDGSPGRGSAAGNCGANEFDDAPLSLNGSGAKLLKVDAFGVTVTVTGQRGENYTIQVEKS
ncbi:uncharacterized protein CTRU02_209249 [Colletotrichum truncatum]|uniref:Uncharacterized protein n=1 Tax=Colletotrichum truncatum TaxID=5467 RepID=A0ACC3YYJ9_COLTU|nr:uncharacterized protein CTRU02_14572 [Colletotrichum truncatum]KAF6782016.1 hypothetical protein CTRU02_14572 [Colletotrichum truncatum]